MKLYATVSSERATKGQGGNRFLDIDIFTTNREKPSHHVHVILSPDEDEAIVSLSARHFGVDRILASDSVFLNIEKGKQEREYCFQCAPHGKYTIQGVCGVCEGINKRTDDEEKGKQQKGELTRDLAEIATLESKLNDEDEWRSQ